MLPKQCAQYFMHFTPIQFNSYFSFIKVSVLKRSQIYTYIHTRPCRWYSQYYLCFMICIKFAELCLADFKEKGFFQTCSKLCPQSILAIIIVHKWKFNLTKHLCYFAGISCDRIKHIWYIKPSPSLSMLQNSKIL